MDHTGGMIPIQTPRHHLRGGGCSAGDPRKVEDVNAFPWSPDDEYAS